MTDEASTQRALGSMEASVRHLTETWARQEANAAAARRALHEKFERHEASTNAGRLALSEKFDDFKEKMVEQISAVKHRLDDIDTTLAEVKPAVKEFRSQREQQKGAMKLGKWIWGLAVAGSGAAASIGTWGLHEWLNRPPGH